ncbi:AAEL017148-PA [Aedes aegypti]|uniref:AAEL017148-PA n=1 Tax=Aedes aegypti TaxID=7159 RepID=J9HJH9_AEDAE|nr:AAEL017148-PA [Aedes aegypti]
MIMLSIPLVLLPYNTHVTLIFAICVYVFVYNGSIIHEKNSNRMCSCGCIMVLTVHTFLIMIYVL